MLPQIEFLEVRLAEVMAYADIPINMRPALTELSSGSMSALAAAGAGTHPGLQAHNLQHLFSGLSSQTDGSGASRAAAMAEASGTGGVAGGIKATQIELVRGALLGCLKMLRQMSEALGESVINYVPPDVPHSCPINGLNGQHCSHISVAMAVKQCQC
jgi:centrosomal protein CEP290